MGERVGSGEDIASDMEENMVEMEDEKDCVQLYKITKLLYIIFVFFYINVKIS